MLEGTYRLISSERDGQDVTDSESQEAQLVIDGDAHDVRAGSDVLAGTHQLDTDVTPHQIDATDTAGPFAGHTVLGIFKLEGDEFTVCFAAPGQPRPTEFTTQDGKATLLHVWKRA